MNKTITDVKTKQRTKIYMGILGGVTFAAAFGIFFANKKLAIEPRNVANANIPVQQVNTSTIGWKLVVGPEKNTYDDYQKLVGYIDKGVEVRVYNPTFFAYSDCLGIVVPEDSSKIKCTTDVIIDGVNNDSSTNPQVIMNQFTIQIEKPTSGATINSYYREQIMTIQKDETKSPSFINTFATGRTEPPAEIPSFFVFTN